MIVYVRHGATPTTGKVLPGRARGLHLSDEGRAQAERTASSLARAFLPIAHGNGAASARGEHGTRGATGKHGEPGAPAPVVAVYASPMERARETAAPIAAALGLRVTIERSLVECDFGSWTGRKLAELGKLPEWACLHSDPTGFRFPDGESFAEMSARVLGAVETLRARHPGGVVVAVSHADPIKVALADALGAHLRSIHRLWVATASVSAVAYSPSGPSVLAVNAMGDLSSIAASP